MLVDIGFAPTRVIPLVQVLGHQRWALLRGGVEYLEELAIGEMAGGSVRWCAAAGNEGSDQAFEQAITHAHVFIAVVQEVHDPWHLFGITSEQAITSQAQRDQPEIFRAQGCMWRRMTTGIRRIVVGLVMSGKLFSPSDYIWKCLRKEFHGRSRRILQA
ncbi:hypothetical protein A9972_18365 [Pseudomonas sp. UME83]|nr:hypothetical protein [Pseudomonas sp. UME83]